MKLLILILALLFPAFSSLAQSQGQNQVVGTARVTVEVVENGIEAHFRLSSPTTAFVFEQGDIARDGNFEVRTPQLTFANDTISSATPFSRFTIKIKNATGEYDAKYAPVRSLGAGRVLHSEALSGEVLKWRMRGNFDMPRGFVSTHRANPVRGGFVFVGPRSYLKDRGSFVSITAPATPTYLEAFVLAEFSTAIGDYSAVLRQNLRSKPLAIIQTNADGFGFTGDMTPGPVAYFRFNGAGWDQPNPQWSPSIKRFVRHELFHFWNGGLVNFGNSPSWLHEGSAEYGAILSSAEKTNDGQSAILAELSQNLTRCEDGLNQEGNPALDQMAFLPSKIRYPCSTIMMWAADMNVRQKSAGRRTFFDVWADLVKLGLTRPDRRYGVDDFTKFVDPNGQKSVEAIALLREASGPERFGKVVAALRANGAQITSAPTLDTRRTQVLFHVLRQYCSVSPFGFFLEDKAVILDTHDGCGLLKGNGTLATVDGFDPSALGEEHFRALQTKCAARATIAFVFIDGRKVDVPCLTNLPDAGSAFTVLRWKP